MYAGLAASQVAITQLVRKWPLTAPIWKSIPDGYRWIPGVVFGFTAGVAEAAMRSTSNAEAIGYGIKGILAVSFPAMGLAAVLRESPLPWDGGAGGKPQR